MNSLSGRNRSDRFLYGGQTARRNLVCSVLQTGGRTARGSGQTATGVLTWVICSLFRGFWFKINTSLLLLFLIALIAIKVNLVLNLNEVKIRRASIHPPSSRLSGPTGRSRRWGGLDPQI